MARELVPLDSRICTSVDEDRRRLGLNLTLKHGDISMIVIELVINDPEGLPRFVMERIGCVCINKIFSKDIPASLLIPTHFHIEGALDLRHIDMVSGPVASVEPSRFVRAVAEGVLVKEIVRQGALVVQIVLVVRGISQLGVRLNRTIAHELVIDDLDLVYSFDHQGGATLTRVIVREGVIDDSSAIGEHFVRQSCIEQVSHKASVSAWIVDVCHDLRSCSFSTKRNKVRLITEISWSLDNVTCVISVPDPHLAGQMRPVSLNFFSESLIGSASDDTGSTIMPFHSNIAVKPVVLDLNASAAGLPCIRAPEVFEVVIHSIGHADVEGVACKVRHVVLERVVFHNNVRVLGRIIQAHAEIRAIYENHTAYSPDIVLESVR